MIRMKELICLASCILVAAALSGQEAEKPQVAKITAIPSEPLVVGDCTNDRSGYIEPKKGQANATETQLGKFVSSNLKSGYILTFYLQTDGRVFVDMQCPSTRAKGR